MGPDDIAGELRHGLRVLTVAMLVLYLILFGSMGFLYRDSLSKRHQDARLTSALCALRADRLVSIAAARAFLRSHPHGAFGLTAAATAATVAEQAATIAALSVINCPDPL